MFQRRVKLSHSFENCVKKCLCIAGSRFALCIGFRSMGDAKKITPDPEPVLARKARTVQARRRFQKRRSLLSLSGFPALMLRRRLVLLHHMLLLLSVPLLHLLRLLLVLLFELLLLRLAGILFCLARVLLVLFLL